MSAHTPSPWYVERKYEGSCTVAIMRDWSKSDVALAVHGPQNWIHVEGVGPDTIEANAHLIAAAPELYDEAKRLRKLLDDLDRACIQATDRGAMMVHIGDLRQLAKAPALDAAIAKAEGRDTAVTR